MSKAEEKALEAYPKKIEWVGNQWNGAPFDVNSKSRVAYEQGYQQAEKDLALTWEDIECIIKHYQDIMSEKSRVFVRVEDYQELLKRFKTKKEK